LKERFGQTNKQVDAHLQALIDLPSPSNTLSSLREFHDAKSKAYPHLGSKNLYGCLLVPILLGKLPTKAKQNLIRAHGKKGWTLSELQAAILNELDILEMGSHPEPLPSVVPPTAFFHTAAKKPATTIKNKPKCPFCAGQHNQCETFKDAKQ